MKGFNRVTLVGNLIRDPELRVTGGGKSVCDVGLAVNDGNDVLFVDVTLWEQSASFADKYLKKGNAILIEGRLKLDTWEKDGQKRAKMSVVGTRIVSLTSGGNSEREAVSAGVSEAHVETGEIPF